MTMSNARSRVSARRAFTLMEMMITAAVIGILAFTVIPAMAPEEGVKLVSASHMLAGDLEYAQSASLSSPSDPIVVVFDADAPRYWLAHRSDPATPIERPGSGSPFIVEMGVDLAQALGGVTFLPENVLDATIRYDALGRLDQLDNAFVRVSNAAGEIFVSISASTGTVAVGKSEPPVIPQEEPATPPEQIVLGGGDVEVKGR